MKYYIVKKTRDEKIVGSDFVQVHSFIKGYNPSAPNALFSLYKYNESFPNYVPDLDGLMVSGSSKLTDIVSNGFSGWFHIINPRVKTLLENYNLCPHRIYPVGLYRRKIRYDYFLLSTLSNYTDFIDYEKTSFIIHEDMGNKENNECIKICSKTEYFEMNDKLKKERGVLWSIDANNIVMSESFDSNLDFFKVGSFDSNLYISERLKLAIEAMGITGWDFIPATNFIVPEK